jgi:SAM-dependent methyltransferase
LAKIRPYVQETLRVKNIGLDFFMWKCSLQTVILSEYDELVIMNSSVYGPLFDISAVFAEMQEKECDCWGITENFEQDWHLQSYFIVFRKSVLSSEAFRLFWASVLPYKNKLQIIRSYEIGLSQWLKDNGFLMEAYRSWKQLARYLVAHRDKSVVTPKNQPIVLRLYEQSKRYVLRFLNRTKIKPINSMVAYPEELIKLDAPFLKLSVLRDNPYNRDVPGILAALESLDYPTEYILTDVNRKSYTSDCPICGHAGSICYTDLPDRFVVNGESRWRLWQCRREECGTSWLDPPPTESDLKIAYQAYYTHKGASDRHVYYPPRYSRVIQITLKAINKSLHLAGFNARRDLYWLHYLTKGDGRLLEVGCGDGTRLAALHKRGWFVEGQEIDPDAVVHCRSKGLEVHEGSIIQLGLSECSYDVILMSHVLEHVENQTELLAHCKKLLKPGGRLVMSVPNIRSLGHFVYKRNWLNLDPPRHVILHSPQSLTNLLRGAGFSIAEMRTVPLNFELIAMHSRDIICFGWTELNSPQRVGKEIVPVLMQILAMIVYCFLPGSGEECFAVAENVAPSLSKATMVNAP